MAQSAEHTASVKTVRRRIFLFLALTFGLSAVVYTFMFTSEVGRGVGFVPLMWAPGIAALLTQLLTRRSFRELGWNPGKARYLLLGYGLPLGLGLIAYGFAWLTGLGGFYDEAFVDNARQLFPVASASPYLVIAVSFAIWATAGMVAGTTLALGEEMGWRGFLVPEVAKLLPFTKTALLCGAIWCVWHYPAVLFFGYRSEAPIGYALFWITVAIMAASFPVTWLRLRSGSLWPAALAHGAQNVFVQQFFDPITADTGVTEYVVGEFGFARPLVGVLAAYVFWRYRDRLPRTLLRREDETCGSALR